MKIYILLIGQLVKPRWVIFDDNRFMSKHKFDIINLSAYYLNVT